METKSKFPVLCTGIVSSCAQFAYFVEMCNYTKCAQVENRAVGAVLVMEQTYYGFIYYDYDSNY